MKDNRTKQRKSIIFEKVYQVVFKIPTGKVMTYGQIGKITGLSPRVVGFALHANPDGKLIPCHRVVNREGRVAPGYAFGGHGVQKKRLEEEGVEFVDETHINLDLYRYTLTS
jgi:methylated-DNA-protein-cysteine methyltransferase related protein